MAKASMEYFTESRDKYQRCVDTTAAEIATLEKQILDQQRADVTVEIQPLAVEGEVHTKSEIGKLLPDDVDLGGDWKSPYPNG